MVAVSEMGGTGRVVVIGNAAIVSDEASQSSRGGSTPISFDLVGVSVDWLRDRPPIPMGIENKTYVEYLFPDPVGLDTTRLLYLPLGLGILLVAGLGAGVWVIRRK